MKGIIFSEMVVLLSGTILIRLNAGESVIDIVIDPAFLRQVIAVLILMAILMTAAESGFGQPAAALGGLVAVGYLVYSAGQLGPASVNLSRKLGG